MRRNDDALKNINIGNYFNLIHNYFEVSFSDAAAA